jgi:hypothetical protein
MNDPYQPDVYEIIEAPPNRVKVVFGRNAVYIYKWYASNAEGKLVLHYDEAIAIAEAILGEHPNRV